MELKYIHLFDLMTLKLFDFKMYVPYGFYFKCLNCRAYNKNNYCVIDLTNLVDAANLFRLVCRSLKYVSSIVLYYDVYRFRPKVNVRPPTEPMKQAGKMPAPRLWPWGPCRTPMTTEFRFANITTCRHRRTADMVGSSCSPASCATWLWTGSLTPLACSSASSSPISVKAKARLLGSVVFCPECTSVQVCRFAALLCTEIFS